MVEKTQFALGDTVVIQTKKFAYAVQYIAIKWKPIKWKQFIIWKLF